MRVQFFYRLIWVNVSVIVQFRFASGVYNSYFDCIYYFMQDAAAHCPKRTSHAQCSVDYLLCRIGIIPNHAMEISEFIGRTITLFHRADSRIPQRKNLKTLPMRNAVLFDGVYSYIKNKNRESG